MAYVYQHYGSRNSPVLVVRITGNAILANRTTARSYTFLITGATLLLNLPDAA
jgi:hypothetical protein